MVFYRFVSYATIAVNFLSITFDQKQNVGLLCPPYPDPVLVIRILKNGNNSKWIKSLDLGKKRHCISHSFNHYFEICNFCYLHCAGAAVSPKSEMKFTSFGFVCNFTVKNIELEKLWTTSHFSAICFFYIFSKIMIRASSMLTSTSQRLQLDWNKSLLRGVKIVRANQFLRMI